MLQKATYLRRVRNQRSDRLVWWKSDKKGAAHEHQWQEKLYCQWNTWEVWNLPCPPLPRLFIPAEPGFHLKSRITSQWKSCGCCPYWKGHRKGLYGAVWHCSEGKKRFSSFSSWGWTALPPLSPQMAAWGWTLQKRPGSASSVLEETGFGAWYYFFLFWHAELCYSLHHRSSVSCGGVLISAHTQRVMRARTRLLWQQWWSQIKHACNLWGESS